MTLKYDELVKDPTTMVHKVHHFLGLTSEKPVRSNVTLKVGSTSLKDEVRNRGEVERALRGTQWHDEFMNTKSTDYVWMGEQAELEFRDMEDRMKQQLGS